MKRFWINERISKELLPHQFHFVDLLLAEIKTTTEQLERATDKNVAYGSRCMDLDRVQYIINSYIRLVVRGRPIYSLFRARLQKIEANPAAVLMEYTERQHMKKDDLLDEREFTFAENYHTSRLQTFNRIFLDKLPDKLKNLPVPRSSRNTRCLVRVTQGLLGVPLFDMSDPNNEILVDLEKDGTYLIPFNSIQNDLEIGSVDLL